MDISGQVSEFIDTHLRSGNVPKKVDAELYNEIQQSLGDGQLLRVIPNRNNDSIDAGEELLQALHNVEMSWGRNVSQEETFEIWFNDGKIEFYFYVDDERSEEKLRRQLRGFYPNVRFVEGEDKFVPIMKSDYVCGTELVLNKSKYIPIRQKNGGVRPFKSDPFKSVMSDMVSDEQTRTMVQVQIKPAHPEWVHGGPYRKHVPFIEYTPWYGDIERKARDVQRPRLLSGLLTVQERSATGDDNSLARQIESQEGIPAYHVDLRIVTFAPREEQAEKDLWSIAKSFETAFRQHKDQHLKQLPRNGSDLDEFLKETASRTWKNRNIILTIPELAGLVHLPNDSVETSEIEWNTLPDAAGVPPGAPSFYDNTVDAFNSEEFEVEDPEDVNSTENQYRVKTTDNTSLVQSIRRTIYSAAMLGSPPMIREPGDIPGDKPTSHEPRDTDTGGAETADADASTTSDNIDESVDDLVDTTPERQDTDDERVATPADDSATAPVEDAASWSDPTEHAENESVANEQEQPESYTGDGRDEDPLAADDGASSVTVDYSDEPDNDTETRDRTAEDPGNDEDSGGGLDELERFGEDETSDNTGDTTS